MIQELDTKKRKIRSLRGFFLYALEIMKGEQEVEVLTTNCRPFFWRKVENIIRQTKKGELLNLKAFNQIKQKNSNLSKIWKNPNAKQRFKDFRMLKQKLNSFEEANQAKLNMLSEASKMPVNEPFRTQQYNLSSNKKQLENGSNFKTSEATSAE